MSKVIEQYPGCKFPMMLPPLPKNFFRGVDVASHRRLEGVFAFRAVNVHPPGFNVQRFLWKIWGRDTIAHHAVFC